MAKFTKSVSLIALCVLVGSVAIASGDQLADFCSNVGTQFRETLNAEGGTLHSLLQLSKFADHETGVQGMVVKDQEFFERISAIAESGDKQAKEKAKKEVKFQDGIVQAFSSQCEALTELHKELSSELEKISPSTQLSALSNCEPAENLGLWVQFCAQSKSHRNELRQKLSMGDAGWLSWV